LQRSPCTACVGLQVARMREPAKGSSSSECCLLASTFRFHSWLVPEQSLMASARPQQNPTEPDVIAAETHMLWIRANFHLPMTGTPLLPGEHSCCCSRSAPFYGEGYHRCSRTRKLRGVRQRRCGTERAGPSGPRAVATSTPPCTTVKREMNLHSRRRRSDKGCWLDRYRQAELLWSQRRSPWHR
jgi:hypothetical protein